MERMRGTILTLIIVLAMLAGEPARALSGLASFGAPGTAQEQSQTCGCGDEDACCCSGPGCEGSGDHDDHDHESCPCSPGPLRFVGGAAGVVAVVERRASVSREHADEIVGTGVEWTTVVVAAVYVGPGRACDSLSVGERLAWWCVRQV